jgi:hypothetical protein
MNGTHSGWHLPITVRFGTIDTVTGRTIMDIAESIRIESERSCGGGPDVGCADDLLQESPTAMGRCFSCGGQRATGGTFVAEKTDHFEYYMKYSEALRNWLVVYGVGGMAFLHEEGDGISRDSLVMIAMPFFVAVLMQVVIAFVNKWDHWLAHAEQEAHHRPWQRVPADWLLWINISADLISLLALVGGSYCLAVAL